ncbi:similar to Saccharomyces cerevisiae YDR070C FMP16 Putative protein of unknown function [Maudiozyma saulgeensis]|uniref:Uncharacterized protein n=1 Tax=Maudiozyma saulgeensis TaxID=1789683 RepID=A0A1X7R9L0_9SACH|nr:similar to Saccharomyces cerevisiae YDR070C FMP16 Putative protein of unknown function [Kazachstania saulgeensis]
MLAPALVRNSMILRPVVVSTRYSMVRMMSSTRNCAKDHRMKHPDAEDVKEQRKFDANKKKLEKLEHGGHSGIMKPSMEKLQQKGENARIEQNRPDDGVY